MTPKDGDGACDQATCNFASKLALLIKSVRVPRAPPAGCRRDLLLCAHFNHCASASLRLPSTNRLIVKARVSAKLSSK